MNNKYVCTVLHTLMHFITKGMPINNIPDFKNTSWLLHAPGLKTTYLKMMTGLFINIRI